MQALLQEIGTRHNLTVYRVEIVTGGDISQCYKIETEKGAFFIKINDAGKYPGMMQTEAKGLKILAGTDTFRLPLIVAEGVYQQRQYLLLEWITPGKQTPDYWEQFAQKLAALHSNTHEFFGLDFNNYIGRLHQVNSGRVHFSDFYSENRILPLVKLLRDQQHYGQKEAVVFDKLSGFMHTLIPEDPPALLHGDLWAGNYLTDGQGQPVLIDPAPYYGHRETDIAMMQLFGGFPPQVFTSYHEQFPLIEGWQKRVALFQLYPLLVHAILFGGNYISQSLSIAKSYT